MNKLILLLLCTIAFSTYAQTTAPSPKQDKIDVYNADGSYKAPIVFDYYEQVDEMPMFPGGKEALEKHIAQKLVYPESAKYQQLEGRVEVRFIISPTGNIMNIKVKSYTDLGDIFIKPSQKIIQSMPKWSPGKLNGTAVYTEIILPIEFKLIK